MIHCLLLLAEGGPATRREAMRLLRQGFNTELAHHELIAYAIAALGVVALVLLLSQVIAQRKRPRPAPRRDYLTEAAKMLALTREERSELVGLAQRLRLPQPAAILLSPANLAYALSRATTGGSAGPLHDRLDELSHKLFGEGLPDDAPSGARPSFQSASSTAEGSQPV